MINSTFSGNAAPSGRRHRQPKKGHATLRNTIVANSVSGGNCSGTIINGGNNMDSGATCGWGTNNGSLSSANPQLGTLTGSPAYFPLNSSSPAIDGVTYNVPNGAPATDQRGVSRPQGAGYDIGAYEVLAHTVTFDANTGSGTMPSQSLQANHPDGATPSQRRATPLRAGARRPAARLCIPTAALWLQRRYRPLCPVDRQQLHSHLRPAMAATPALPQVCNFGSAYGVS